MRVASRSEPTEWTERRVVVVVVLCCGGRFQELDVSVSAHVVSYSSLEEAWRDKVTATLSQKADYRMVRLQLLSIMHCTVLI